MEKVCRDHGTDLHERKESAGTSRIPEVLQSAIKVLPDL